MIKKEYSLLGIIMLLLALPVMAAAQNAHPHDGHYRSDSTSLQRTQRIREVVVHGKYVDRVNKSAYNAVAIDTRKACAIPTSTWHTPSIVWQASKFVRRAV